MTVSGGKDLRRSLRKLKQRLHEEANNAADDGLDKVERRAKRNIMEKDAVATGTLFRSFVQSVTDEVIDGARVRRYKLANTAPYAPMQEYGTGSYFAQGMSWGYNVPVNPYEAPSFSLPLIAAIDWWMKTKPGFHGDRNTNPFVEDDAVKIAYNIARPTENDPRTGTPPQPFMRPAWFASEQEIRTDFKLRVKRAVMRF